MYYLRKVDKLFSVILGANIHRIPYSMPGTVLAQGTQKKTMQRQSASSPETHLLRGQVEMHMCLHQMVMSAMKKNKAGTKTRGKLVGREELFYAGCPGKPP